MSPWSWTGLLTVLLMVGEGQGSTHFIYMTSYCSRTLDVNTSLSVALTPADLLVPDRGGIDLIHCALNIRAPRGRKLFVHFMQLSVAPETRHVDRVMLYDLEPEKIPLTPPGGLYGKLERQLFIFDDAGVFIEDYVTTNRKLRIDYLGIPTVKNPGFRLLVTSVKDAAADGGCPKRWFRCKHQALCVPPDSSCDGLYNCGKDDLADEQGCERDERVTDLLQTYSLTRDILVVVLLPLAAFLLIVIAMWLCYKRQIRKKFPPEVPPPVLYSANKGGRVEILPTNQEMTRLYAPPSYEDIFRPASMDPPPAYSSLASLEQSGSVTLGAAPGSRGPSPRTDSQRHLRVPRSMRKRDEESGSGSSIDTVGVVDQQGGRLTQYERYRRHNMSCPSDSDNDDEETRRRRRRKCHSGAKAKGKKRRADEVCLNLQPITIRTNPMSSSPHGPSPLASPSSGCSVPYPSSSSSSSRLAKSSPSSSSASPDQSVPATIPAAVPSSQGRRPNSMSPNAKGKVPVDPVPIHIQAVIEHRPASQNSKTESMKCESSGNEADRKSDSESRSANKRDSRTESLVSSAESVKDKVSQRAGRGERKENGADFHAKPSQNMQRHGATPRSNPPSADDSTIV